MSDAGPREDSRDLFGETLAPARKGRQLPLPLGWRSSGSDTAPHFIVGDSNRAAAQHVLGHAGWEMPASLLIGPPQSGKTVLGQMFVDSGGGDLIDGLAGTDEAALFHGWNRAKETGQRLLVIVDSPAEIAAVALADLKTRLATAPVLEIGAPDACLTRDLIEYLLVQRGLQPAPQLGSYVTARIERSYMAIHAAVAAIDTHALAHGGGAGIRNARAALIAAGLYDGAANDSDSPEPA